MKNTDKISCIEYCNFNGERYGTRRVNIKEFGERCIAGYSLKNALFTEGGAYVSDEAREIDEGIFFFVEDKYLSFDDKKLAAHVEKNVA